MLLFLGRLGNDDVSKRDLLRQVCEGRKITKVGCQEGLYTRGRVLKTCSETKTVSTLLIVSRRHLCVAPSHASASAFASW